MNILERIKNFLAREDRNVVYGRPLSVEGMILSLSMGESDEAELSLGDFGCISYQTVNVTVYSDDYLQGYDLLLSVRNEIATAAKNTVKIAFKRFNESDYDTSLGKHVLKSQYKIFE